MREWEAQEDEKLKELEADDKPQERFDELMNEAKQKIIDKWTQEEEEMKAFCEQMKEKNIPVIILNGDLSIDRVFARVQKSLQPYIEERNSIFERQQIQDLRPRDVEKYERSYHYKKS